LHLITCEKKRLDGIRSLVRSLAIASSSRAASRGAAACTRDRAPIRRSITHCIVICDPARRLRVRTRDYSAAPTALQMDRDVGGARCAPGDVLGNREIWEMPLLTAVMAGTNYRLNHQ